MTTHAKYTYIRNDRLLALIQYLNRANFAKEKKTKKLFFRTSSVDKGLAPTFTRVEVGVLKTFSREPFTNKTPSFPFEICTFTTWSRQSWRNLWMGSKALNNENVLQKHMMSVLLGHNSAPFFLCGWQMTFLRKFDGKKSWAGGLAVSSDNCQLCDARRRHNHWVPDP